MLTIEGDYGEGGGQLTRMAIALAAVTLSAVRLTRIRARRSKPGLAAQHLTALRAVASVAQGEIEGLALGSTEVVFRPGTLRGGEYVFDIGTAGSITLLLQALMPVMLRAPQPLSVRVIGGTDVRAAPPLDYLRFVLLPLLEAMGAAVSLEVLRRGYYPRGGGEVGVRVQPGALHAPKSLAPGRLRSVTGGVQTARLPAHIAQRMRDAAERQLAARGLRADWVLDADVAAFSPGGAIVLAADRTTTHLGAGRVAERGVRAEELGDAAGGELAADLERNLSLDVHAADQLIVYLALANGAAAFTTRGASPHMTTAIWLAQQFLPARFRIDEQAGGAVRVTCMPAGP